MTFITLLAWIFGVLFSIIFGLRFVGATLNQFSKTYQIQQRLRQLQTGQVITYPWIVPFMIAAICWAWIITQ